MNFARSGDPNGPGLPHWPTMQEEPGKIMQLDEQVRVIPRPGAETLKVLEAHFFGSPDHQEP